MKHLRPELLALFAELDRARRRVQTILRECDRPRPPARKVKMRRGK